MFTDDDYIVEQYVKPQRVGKKLINDERADLLGNFDDDDDKHGKKKGKKSKEKVIVSEENPFDDDDGDESEDGENGASEANEDENGADDDAESDGEQDEESDEAQAESEHENEDENGDDNEDESMAEINSENHDSESEPEPNVPDKPEPKVKNKKQKAAEKTKSQTSKKIEKKLDLTDDQLKALMRGASKKDKFVLYVTNLSYSTTRDTLTEFFSTAGTVKSVRIPKVRRNAFAFVEMNDVNGFRNALALHNRTLDNYTIKVQISEAGKKKSANKKNILKQKNRKLAEMRNESKQFQRSGKGYDKTIKKEINQRKMQQNRRLAKKAAKKAAR